MNNPSEKLIAVVGTMKAGKSTVINAIVGREVLPTRELPMTTIPTLVRHVPGQTEPVLEFSQKSTIEALLPQLATAISNPKNTSIIESSLCCSYNDQLIPSILDFVYRNKKLKKQYTGSIQILEFLRSLNDFTGLCRYLDIDFPFEKFNHIQNLPTISVEFQSLKYLNNPAQVQLALLDTPGPNESGQVHLREMLQDQVEKSSAVLAILDYTQLKSDANEEVNSYLIEIASISKGRLYALVNKFDEQGENSLELDEVKNLVANQLLKKEISEDCVFPVSSRNAYLANSALNTLDLHQELPDHETEPWVEDFGLQAFGRRWKNNISDLVETKYAANYLWDDSLLQESLNAIFQSLTEQSHHHKNQTSENKATATVTPSHLSFLKAQSMPITIQDLQAEAIRLVDFEIKILQDIFNAKDVLIDDSQGKQTFDKKSTVKRIEILTGEKEKLKNLETVIAVVGTMKAGKSTTINAIVGSEVLPNRELPMTAIPTLIRHTAGQTEPVLEFNHKAPIDDLLIQITEATKNPKNSSNVEKIKEDKEKENLINAIQELTENNKTYKTKYTGVNQIFTFLKGLNDLVRLSEDLKIDFPFKNYKKINEFPVIKIEFHSLKELNQTHGQLTLLDTPGPNEHGREHLKAMLPDQLQKASAVLAILDYTQLNSDSTVKVKKELEKITSAIADNRLYTLINKFDQNDRNSRSKDDIIKFVAKNLLEGNIPEKQIFPVSSRQAYLANRVRHELSKNQQLPNHEDEPWVGDFGEEAFGKRWKNQINDIKEVKEAANDVWKDSHFEEPLKNVIEASHKQAAQLAVISASSKIKEISNDLGNFFSVQTQSLTEDISKLQDQVSQLGTKINNIEYTKISISNQLDDAIRDLDNQISSKTDSTYKELQKEIAAFFKKGKSIQEEEFNEAMRNFLNKKQNSGFFSGSIKKTNQERPIFDPDSPIIRIEKEDQAKQLIEEIEKSISRIIDLSEAWLKNEVIDTTKKFTDEFSKTVEEKLSNVIEDIETSMGKNGFNIKLTPPNIDNIAFITSTLKMSEIAIDKKQESYSYRTWEGGFLNNFLNKLNDDWGWTKKTGTRNYFEIDTKSIGKETEQGIKEIFSDVSKVINQSIIQPLQENSNEFFQELEQKIEKIQGDISYRIQNANKSEKDKAELRAQSEKMLNLSEILDYDAKELSKAIKEYKQ